MDDEIRELFKLAKYYGWSMIAWQILTLAMVIVCIGLVAVLFLGLIDFARCVNPCGEQGPGVLTPVAQWLVIVYQELR